MIHLNDRTKASFDPYTYDLTLDGHTICIIFEELKMVVFNDSLSLYGEEKSRQFQKFFESFLYLALEELFIER